MDSQVADRFVIRPGATGFRVVDAWTGDTAVIATVMQDGMSEADARHTALLLNQRSGRGERPRP